MHLGDQRRGRPDSPGLQVGRYIAEFPVTTKLRSWPLMAGPGRAGKDSVFRGCIHEHPDGDLGRG